MAYAQNQMPICGSGVDLELNCSDACVVCDLNGVTGFKDHTVPGSAPPGFCTFTVHSIRYFAFVAGSTNLSFTVTVTSCTRGSGLELGVYETPDCSSFNLVSNCNTAMPVGTHAFSTNTPLKIGCIYYLVFDGNGVSACFFRIAVTAGSGKAPTPKLSSPIIGKKKMCVGEVETYTAGDFIGACSSTWSVENGDIISSTKNSVTVRWTTPGKGRVCINGFNQCQEKMECIDVIIGEDTEYDLGVFYTCPGTLVKVNNRLYSEGHYNFRLKNYLGCDSLVTFDVENYFVEETNIDTTICFPDCIVYNGIQYCDTGRFDLRIPTKQFPFCDSVLHVRINKLIIIPRIYKSGDLSCFDTIVTLSADSSIVSGGMTAIYEWYDNNNKLIGTGLIYKTSLAGIYKLKILQQNRNGKFCDRMSSIEVKGNTLKPNLIQKNIAITCGNEYFNWQSIVIDDVNGTNFKLNYFFEKAGVYFPIDTSVKHLFTRDTVIYIVGQSGICSDTIRAIIRLDDVELIIHPDIYICKNEIFHTKEILLQYNNPNTIIDKFYNRASVDPLYRVDSMFLINRDTALYFNARNKSCSQFYKINIFVKELAQVSFNKSNDTICEGEKLIIKFDFSSPLYMRKLAIDQKEIVTRDSILIIDSLPSGLHRIHCSASYNSCDAEFSDYIYVKRKLNLPTIQCESTDSTILFYWTNVDTLILKINVGTNGMVNYFRNSVLISNLLPGQKASISLHYNDKFCGDQVVSTTCSAVQCPKLKVKLNPIDPICLDRDINQQLVLVANASSVIPNWQWKYQGIGIIDSILGVFDPKIAGVGFHQIIATYSNGYCNSSDTLVLRIRQQPKFIINAADKLCIDSLHQISLIGVTDPDDDANIDIIDASLVTQVKPRTWNVKWKNPGIKKLKFTIKNGICEQYLEKEIEVIQAPQSGFVTCKAESDRITYTWHPSDDSRIVKVILNPNVNYLMPNDTTIIVPNLASNTEIKLQLMLSNGGPCADIVSSWFTCTTPNCPSLNVLRDTSLKFCKSELPAYMDLSSLLNSSIKSESWFLNGSKFSQNNFPSQNLAIGINRIYIKASNDNCNYEDSVDIIVGDKPDVDIRHNELDCTKENELGYIELKNLSGGIPPYSYRLNQKVLNSNFVEFLSEGKYTIQVSDSLQCDTSYVIEFVKPDVPVVDLGPDLEIIKGDRIEIPVKIKGDYSYFEWQNSKDLSCNNCIDPIANPSLSRWYILKIEDSTHCFSIDSVFIKVRDNSIYFPNVFSPNFDQVNDRWIIYGSEDIKSIPLVEIYTRWGELIYRSSKYKINSEEEAWTGIYRGYLLQPGTYVYHVRVQFSNEDLREFTGDVNLIR